MALGGAIDLFDIGMRDLIESDMAVFAPQLSMHRMGKTVFVDVKDSLVPLLIVAPHTGVAVTK